jgi:hypothetical protein
MATIESQNKMFRQPFCITDNCRMEPPKKQIGRPLKFPGEKLEQRSIRLTAAQWAKVDAAGIAALRKLIDRWRPR